MDTGLPRLEFEAHGRIASAVAKTRENRASYDKNQRNSAFQAPFYRPGRFKTDRLLATVHRRRHQSHGLDLIRKYSHRVAPATMCFESGSRLERNASSQSPPVNAYCIDLARRNSFTFLHSLGQELPVASSPEWSSDRPLDSETCRKAYASNSALSVIGCEQI